MTVQTYGMQPMDFKQNKQQKTQQKKKQKTQNQKVEISLLEQKILKIPKLVTLDGLKNSSDNQ